MEAAEDAEAAFPSDGLSVDHLIAMLEFDAARHSAELAEYRQSCEQRFQEQQQRHAAELAELQEALRRGGPLPPLPDSASECSAAEDPERHALRLQLCELQRRCAELRKASASGAATSDGGNESDSEGTNPQQPAGQSPRRHCIRTRRGSPSPVRSRSASPASQQQRRAAAEAKRARQYLRQLRRERGRLEYDYGVRCKVLWLRTAQAAADSAAAEAADREGAAEAARGAAAHRAVALADRVLRSLRREQHQGVGREKAGLLAALGARERQMATLTATLAERQAVLWRMRTELEADERAAEERALARVVPAEAAEQWRAAVRARAEAQREATAAAERAYDARLKWLAAAEKREELAGQRAAAEAAAAGASAAQVAALRERLAAACCTRQQLSCELHAARSDPVWRDSAEAVRELCQRLNGDAERLAGDRQRLRQHVGLLNSRLSRSADSIRAFSRHKAVLQQQQRLGSSLGARAAPAQLSITEPQPAQPLQPLREAHALRRSPPSLSVEPELTGRTVTLPRDSSSPLRDGDAEGDDRYHELPPPASPRQLRAARGRRGAALTAAHEGSPAVPAWLAAAPEP
eukprot:TRINITY_DN28980_c0_g1_i2.p1 TRINITY_DN28980_c0_g1~~TRINITY_DN28980_c0_g1_i2.p1  ORF type:complete len:609 (+),score=226.17 TRINITY_DN28980_c0_g1_i2:86-1828(+)